MMGDKFRVYGILCKKRVNLTLSRELRTGRREREGERETEKDEREKDNDCNSGSV
jgi:hypothetical protein